MKNWISFCSDKASLKDIDWIDRSMLIKVYHPKQIDEFNCGVFVAYFLKNFLLNHFTFYFENCFENLFKMRQEMLFSIMNSLV